MPISYEIDEEQEIVRTTVTGRLTDDELLAHKQALVEDPRFREGMKELSDIRGVTELDITPEGVLKAVSFDATNASRFGTHRLGILVGSDHVFGMARMYEMRTDGNTGGVAVFRSVEEARSWVESP